MPDTEPNETQRLLAELNALLRLKTTVIGMKLFETAAEMEAIPRIRRPKTKHTTDQIVSMASRLGWTVGITAADLVGAQCQAVIGLAPQDEDWRRGEKYVGVWHGTQQDAQARQEALTCVPHGRFQAMAVSPLDSGRLDPPDIAMVYATPGADDHPHQRPAVPQLPQVRMVRGGRDRLRRQLGPRAGDRRAEPVAALLRRAALRRRAGRGDADGAEAGRPARRGGRA